MSQASLNSNFMGAVAPPHPYGNQLNSESTVSLNAQQTNINNIGTHRINNISEALSQNNDDQWNRHSLSQNIHAEPIQLTVEEEKENKPQTFKEKLISKAKSFKSSAGELAGTAFEKIKGAAKKIDIRTVAKVALVATAAILAVGSIVAIFAVAAGATPFSGGASLLLLGAIPLVSVLGVAGLVGLIALIDKTGGKKANASSNEREVEEPEIQVNNNNSFTPQIQQEIDKISKRIDKLESRKNDADPEDRARIESQILSLKGIKEQLIDNKDKLIAHHASLGVKQGELKKLEDLLTMAKARQETDSSVDLSGRIDQINSSIQTKTGEIDNLNSIIESFVKASKQLIEQGNRIYKGTPQTIDEEEDEGEMGLNQTTKQLNEFENNRGMSIGIHEGNRQTIASEGETDFSQLKEQCKARFKALESEIAQEKDPEVLEKKKNELRGLNDLIVFFEKTEKDIQRHAQAEKIINNLEGESSDAENCLRQVVENMEEINKFNYAIMKLKYGSSDLTEEEARLTEDEKNEKIEEYESIIVKLEERNNELYEEIDRLVKEESPSIENNDGSSNGLKGLEELFSSPENSSSNDTSNSSRNVPNFNQGSFTQQKNYSSHSNAFNSFSEDYSEVKHPPGTSNAYSNPVPTPNQNKTSSVSSSAPDISKAKPKKEVSFGPTTEFGKQPLDVRSNSSTPKNENRGVDSNSVSQAQQSAMDVLQNEIQEIDRDIRVIGKKIDVGNEIKSSINAELDKLYEKHKEHQMDELLNPGSFTKELEVIDEKINVLKEALDKVDQKINTLESERDAQLSTKKLKENKLYTERRSLSNTSSSSAGGNAAQNALSENLKNSQEQADLRNEREDLLKERLQVAEIEMASLLLPALLYQKKDNKPGIIQYKLGNKEDEEELVSGNEGNEEMDQGKEKEQ